jgi:hypothetical protein
MTDAEWARAPRVPPIRCWRYPASRALRRPSYRSSSERWSTPNVAPVRALPREQRELVSIGARKLVLHFRRK